MTELTYNLNEGIQTSNAEYLFKEHFKIQTMLTEVNQLNNDKSKTTKAPKAKEDLA